jgi:hypothetical protein
LSNSERGYGEVLVGRFLGIRQNGGDRLANEGQVGSRVGLVARVEDLSGFVFRVKSEDTKTESLYFVSTPSLGTLN